MNFTLIFGLITLVAVAATKIAEKVDSVKYTRVQYGLLTISLIGGFFTALLLLVGLFTGVIY